MHLNVHVVKQKNKAKPTMPRHVVQHSEPDVLSLTSSDFMTAKKSASVTGDILMGDNGQSSVVVKGLPAEILRAVNGPFCDQIVTLCLRISPDGSFLTQNSQWRLGWRHGVKVSRSDAIVCTLSWFQTFEMASSTSALALLS